MSAPTDPLPLPDPSTSSPPPLPVTPPPIPQSAQASGRPVIMVDQGKKDEEQLKILSILYFVFAGLSLVGLLFIAAHYLAMSSIIEHPEMWKNQEGAEPLPAYFLIGFQWMYLLMALMIVVGGAINFLAGVYLRQKRNRLFTFVVAGLNCLQFPLGTTLGVFTFVVLLRDSVVAAYDEVKFNS